MTTERLLDVSHLEPCEPLERTLEAIATLAENERLCVLHRRDPRLLYPILDERGFAWQTREGGAAGFEIRIWRRSEPQAAPDQ